MTKPGLILLGAMAFAFSGVGVYCLVEIIRIQYFGLSTTGTVEGYNLSYVNSNPFTEEGQADFYANGEYSSNYNYPVVSYTTENDRHIYFLVNEGSEDYEYEVGEQVKVYYDPKSPGDAQIENEGWLLPVIFIPVGLLLFFAVWKVWPRE